MSTLGRNVKDELNRMAPATSHAKLGDMLEKIISNQNAILAKLDAIGGAGASSAAIAAAAGTNNAVTMALTPPSQL